MAVRLFNLRNVPDDEANEVRALLDAQGIDFYETHAGFWGIASAGIWLHDDRRLEEAKRLIAEYQQERAKRMRAHYEQLRRDGLQPTVWHNIRRHPVQFILLIGMVMFVLYVSLSPFLNFLR